MFFIVSMYPDYRDFSDDDKAKSELEGEISKAIESFEDFGVKLHGQYSNQIEHRMVLVIEADCMTKIHAAFYPLLKFCEQGVIAPYQKIN